MTFIAKSIVSLIFMAAASTLFADTVTEGNELRPTDAMIAPLLPLNTSLPITLSYENRKDQFDIENQQQMAANVHAVIESKTFPWLTLVALCALAFTLLLILILPSAGGKKKDDKEELERQKMRIKNILKKLSVYSPETPEDARVYFTNVENSLKQLLNAEYEINTVSRTSQELSHDLEQLRELPPGLKRQLTVIFDTNDKIKFAKYQPASADYAEASETARAAGNLITPKE